MTTLTDSELLAIAAAGELAATFARRFGLQDESEIRATEEACARLHNSGAWDLLAHVENGEFQGLDGSKFFLASHVFQRIVPQLEAAPLRMAACIEALVSRGGADMAASWPNAAFRNWCARDLGRARAILRAAHEDDRVARRNLTFALEAIGSPAEARAFLNDTDEARRTSAITALGRIADVDLTSRAETIAAFSRLAEVAGDDQLTTNLLIATTTLLSQPAATIGDAERDLIGRLTASPSAAIIHAAAHALWSCPAARHPKIVQLLLGAVRQVEPANRGTFEEIDRALTTLLDAGETDVALDFVQHLFTGPGELALSELDAFVHHMTSGPIETLGRAVVRWLVSGEMRLCEALVLSLRRDGDEAPVLDVEDEVRGLSDVQQLFLCRKAMGWLIIKPRTAASILVSVMRVCADDLAETLEGYLVEPLLTNSGGLRDYLAGLDAADPAKARVAAALAQNDAYLAGLRSVPDIKELAPSEAQKRVQRLRSADQGREIAKQARKHSVLLSLVKRSVVLYGRRTRGYVKDRDGSTRWVEMDLKPHGVSFELPRMEIVDPVGLDYMARVFRLERIAS